MAAAAPIHLSFTEPVNLRSDTGYLPVKINGIETGVEVYPLEPEELAEARTYSGCEECRCGFAFRWSGAMNECIAASVLAAAIAKTASGLVIDREGGTAISADQAATDAVRIVKELE